MDTHSHHASPHVTTSFRLHTGWYYVARVTGAYSYYAPGEYAAHARDGAVLCGTPAAAPMFPSRKAVSGPVGIDPEFVFARPWSSQACAKHHLPYHQHLFQMNNGSGYRHPQLVGPEPAMPYGDHTYRYAVVGINARVGFRIKDHPARDNYGIVKIVLRPAVQADCSSFRAFGFRTESACSAAVAGQTGWSLPNQPARASRTVRIRTGSVESLQPHIDQS